jgi:preprotein translocase subunit YajC
MTLLLLAPQSAPAGPNPLTMFLPMILIFVVIYLLIIRPQKKKEDTRQKMVAAVKKGDKVVTIGGMHGSVTQVDETSVLVQVDSSVKVRIEKNALSSVVSKDS